MKFQILDLIVVTAMVALLFGTFQNDLFFFRQLLYGCFVALGSTLCVVADTNPRRRRIKCGAIGGLVAASVFIAFTHTFASYCFPTEPELLGPDAFFRSVPLWQLEIALVILFAAPLGSVLGPLLAMRIRQEKIPAEKLKPFWLSMILLAASFVFGLMAMDDRFTMGHPNRNWAPIQAIFLIAFIIQTLRWMRQPDDAEKQPTPG